MEYSVEKQYKYDFCFRSLDQNGHYAYIVKQNMLDNKPKLTFTYFNIINEIRWAPFYILYYQSSFNFQFSPNLPDCYEAQYTRLLARRRPGSLGFNILWASMRDTSEQQRRRPACASAQSEQRHCYSLSEKKSIFFLNIFGGLQHDKASGYAPAHGHFMISSDHCYVPKTVRTWGERISFVNICQVQPYYRGKIMQATKWTISPVSRIQSSRLYWLTQKQVTLIVEDLWKWLMMEQTGLWWNIERHNIEKQKYRKDKI